MAADSKAQLRPGMVCWSCRFFNFTGSTPSYSDVTPGDNATMGCQQGIWDLDFSGDSQADFERKMKTAENCEDFEAR
jgi:hypothetical protein